MNLPDDWHTYYSTCETCGERRHASGDTECACDRGEAPVDDEDDAAIEREMERREEPWDGGGR